MFTTHTPVAAGNDTYSTRRGAAHARRASPRPRAPTADDVIALGRTHPDDAHEPFGVTQYALRASRTANGVSRRHGEVAREMWHGLWPERAVEGVPITHVTNGVHVPSWVGAPMRRLLDRHLGERLGAARRRPDAFAAIDDIPAADLWAARREQRELLVEFVRDRSQLDRIARGEPREYVEASARVFDPDVLTIGFARRLATYKRLHLLLHDLDRGDQRCCAASVPVQLLLAGKAHPKDDEAKRLVQGLFGARCERSAFERVVFLEDYDLGLAARLVRGCDLWINLPRPPLEASGTSGMKVAVNGGLQLSVLDGWWAEAYDGDNGWALTGDADPDHGRAGHAPRARDVPPARGGGRARVLRPRRRRHPAGVGRARQALDAHADPRVLGRADGQRVRVAHLPLQGARALKRLARPCEPALSRP